MDDSRYLEAYLSRVLDAVKSIEVAQLEQLATVIDRTVSSQGQVDAIDPTLRASPPRPLVPEALVLCQPKPPIIASIPGKCHERVASARGTMIPQVYDIRPPPGRPEHGIPGRERGPSSRVSSENPAGQVLSAKEFPKNLFFTSLAVKIVCGFSLPGRLFLGRISASPGVDNRIDFPAERNPGPSVSPARKRGQSIRRP